MHNVSMASQSGHGRKPTLACSSGSVVAKVDAGLVISPWHQIRAAETAEKETVRALSCLNKK